MDPIKLDLSRPEYDERFYSQDLWQRQAADILIKHLKRFGKQASCNKIMALKLNESLNIHNAILISGGRGTGKSVFLKNVEVIWQAYAESSIKSSKYFPELFFMPLIDPTLLQDHDSFTNVLVAHIYNQVVDKVDKCTCQQLTKEDESNKQRFYEVLRKLALAIEQPGERSEHTGLDKIIQYSSGIKIDSLFNEFIAAAKSILNCDAIVLPIDDVDMALDQAYPVLEEIRRRLSCPDIIPIVSGDLELYQHLVKLKLSQSLKSCLAGDEKLYGDEKSGRLAEAYLTKILPNHYRIALQSIDDLISHLTIIDPDILVQKNEILYLQYQRNLKKHFFGFINGEEKSTDYPLPSSAREVGQLVRLLPPSILLSKKKHYLEDWENLRIWSEGMRHGAGYVLARSAIQFLHKSEPFRLNQLISFNVKEQANERLPWAQYEFIDEQISSAAVFDQKINTFLLSHTISDRILRSMPPLEMHTDNMSITGTNAKIDPNPLALIIYTNWAYYSTQGYQQRKIFFSRAFDLLATSLLMSASLDTTQTNKNIDKEWSNKFKEIINTIPFYSIHALNPTKTVEENSLKDQYADDNNELFSDGTIISEFANNLVQWSKINSQDVHSYFEDKTQIIALLSAVFNKAFSQINILRGLYHNGENATDQLLDSILRFRYILANAFGFFIKSQGVVSANIALATLPSTLREKSTFANSSSTYKRNVSWADLDIDSDIHTKKSHEEHSNKSNYAGLLKMIMNHPVFTELGINIDSCVDVKSALITNSSGTSRRQNTNAITKIRNIKTKVKGKRFNEIKNITGKDKKYSSPDELCAFIEKGLMSENQKKDILNELDKELLSNDFGDYAKNHQKVYEVLVGKKDA